MKTLDIQSVIYFAYNMGAKGVFYDKERFDWLNYEIIYKDSKDLNITHEIQTQINSFLILFIQDEKFNIFSNETFVFTEDLNYDEFIKQINNLNNVFSLKRQIELMSNFY